MLKKLTLAALIIMSAATSGFAADEATPPKLNYSIAEVPIFSQKLRFKLPTDWQHVQSKQNGSTYLIEFIPKDEKIESWKNLFSIQGFQDFDPETKPQDVADSVHRGFAKLCPETSVYTKIGERVLNGQDAFLAVIGCAEMPNDHATNLKKGMSEIAYYVFIKGTKDLYFAQKSIRGAGFTNDVFPPFVNDAILEMTDFFPIEFCTLDSPRGTCLK